MSELEILQQRVQTAQRRHDATEAEIERLRALSWPETLAAAINALAAKKAILERLEAGVYTLPSRDGQLTIAPPAMVRSEPSAFWPPAAPRPLEARDLWENRLRLVETSHWNLPPNSCSHPNKDPEIYRQVCHELGVPIEAVREHFAPTPEESDESAATVDRLLAEMEKPRPNYVIVHGGAVQEGIPYMPHELDKPNPLIIHHLAQVADILAPGAYSPRHRRASRWYRAWQALTPRRGSSTRHTRTAST